VTETDHVRIDDLHIEALGTLLVRGVSLRVDAGELVALVGASGSGKSLTAKAVLGLIRPLPGVVAGSVTVRVGAEALSPYSSTGRAREAEFKRLRGRLVGYLPQAAAAALDPVWSVGKQVAAVVALSAREGGKAERVEHWLRKAGFRDPAVVASLYAHELSGGMAQRVCIALALARGSRFLLADEPTTGLDPTVQESILSELAALRDAGLGVLFITHDLRLVPRLADRVTVLDAGAVAETLSTADLNVARSPAARLLISATSRIAGGAL
jgi:ABC-type glutathione transport system ATPase component